MSVGPDIIRLGMNLAVSDGYQEPALAARAMAGDKAEGIGPAAGYADDHSKPVDVARPVVRIEAPTGPRPHDSRFGTRKVVR